MGSDLLVRTSERKTEPETRRCRHCGTNQLFSKPLSEALNPSQHAYRVAQRALVVHCPRCRQTEICLRNKFGIDLAQYRIMYRRQKGTCMICKTWKGPISSGLPQTETLVIDHCHTSGRIRALLCWSCNVTIGHAKEDPGILHEAARYVLRHANKKKVSRGQ